MERQELKDLVESVFALGMFYQAYLTTLVVYEQAKNDPAYREAQAKALIHMQSMCNKLGLTNPCKVPSGNREAKQQVAGFFSVVQDLAEQLNRQYGKKVGGVLLFASSSAARQVFVGAVESDVARKQEVSLIEVGRYIGLGSSEVESYLASPDQYGHKIVDQIIAHLEATAGVVEIHKTLLERLKRLMKAGPVPWLLAIGVVIMTLVAFGEALKKAWEFVLRLFRS